MTLTPLFDVVSLENRLGQAVDLGVKLLSAEQRQYLFLRAPNSAPSSLIGKNAEHFAYQLVRRYELDPDKVVFVEMRDQSDTQALLCWSFEWVGHSAHAARSHQVTKRSQQAFLTSVLTGGTRVANQTSESRLSQIS